MLEYDFHSSIGYWLCMTAHAYERAANERLASRGVTYRQAQVLAWLAHEGELSQTDLAGRMNIEPPTLVRVLDRMVRDGLVSREGSTEDRRRNVIRPLAKARPMWKKITAVAESLRQEVVEGMTPKEIATLNALLGKVRANLRNEAEAKKKRTAATGAIGGED